MKRGPAPKPEARRQRRGSAGITLWIVPEPQRPTARRGWLKATKEAWAEYWDTPLASLAIRFGITGVVRLFDLKDERERSYRGYRAARVWTGSTGQLKVSGHLGAMLDLDAEIDKLEDRYGLTPGAGIKLGLQLLGAHEQLEEMNRRLDDDVDPDDGEDPRLALVRESGDPGRVGPAAANARAVGR